MYSDQDLPHLKAAAVSVLFIRHIERSAPVPHEGPLKALRSQMEAMIATAASHEGSIGEFLREVAERLSRAAADLALTFGL